MMDVVGGSAAVIAGVPWILSERCDSAFDPSRAKVHLRRQIARGAAAVVSNSSSGSAYWVKRVPESRCSVIPNALPVDEIESAGPAKRSTFDFPDDAPLIVYVGRLDPQKNMDRMLDALERVVAQSDARALLCGQGPLQAEVEKRVASAGLRGRVVAPGFVSNPWSWLKTADLFVSVSLWEGMPNTVMEAMAAGCAVVVSDIPHHREVLDSSTARFVPANDADAIADAILAGLRDPERGARAAAAKQRAQKWSIPATARRWANFYEELAAGPQPSSQGGSRP
jgi:glycosyltransferase involved in cell wall biosynthesis